MKCCHRFRWISDEILFIYGPGAAGSDGYRISFRFYSIFPPCLLVCFLFFRYLFSASPSSCFETFSFFFIYISHSCWWRSIATSTSISPYRWSMTFHLTVNICFLGCKNGSFWHRPQPIFDLFHQNFWFTIWKMTHFDTILNRFSFFQFVKIHLRENDDDFDQFHQIFG